MRFRDIPQFMPRTYEVDVGWDHIQMWFDERMADNRIELNPDFQRAHVWTPEQQTAFVEYSLRGGESGRNLYFNCRSWWNRTMAPEPIYIVDGKQRLTAAMEFMADRIPAFGFTRSQYEDRFPIMEVRFRFHVADLQTRAEVIIWYLDLNYAGTPHTEEERARVRTLLEQVSA